MTVEESSASMSFLSIQAQDFIEDNARKAAHWDNQSVFLSIQAQDFIEEVGMPSSILMIFYS